MAYQDDRHQYISFVRQFRRSNTGVLGLGIVLVWGIVALAAPIISPEGPFLLSDSYLQPPSARHLAGTDHLGRDVFDRVVWGSRVSFLFALGVAGISAIAGVALGAIPGYFGGVVDDLFSRGFEVFLTLPRLFLLILITTLIGTNIYLTMVFIGLTIWPTNAKITRIQVLTTKKRFYVRAAIASGTSRIGVLVRHILPNGISPVMTNSMLEMSLAIKLEASLSFLGLGDPNQASWGQIIQMGRWYVTSWWLTFFPGIAITSLVLGFSFLGDGLNYVLNPRFGHRNM